MEPDVWTWSVGSVETRRPVFDEAETGSKKRHETCNAVSRKNAEVQELLKKDVV